MSFPDCCVQMPFIRYGRLLGWAPHSPGLEAAPAVAALWTTAATERGRITRELVYHQQSAEQPINNH
jgi:hypothetical protein